MCRLRSGRANQSLFERVLDHHPSAHAADGTAAKAATGEPEKTILRGALLVQTAVDGARRDREVENQ